MSAAPIVVLPDAAAVEAAAVQLRRKGHAARGGFALEPDGDFDVREQKLICTGVIDGAEAARSAVLAAARGASVLLAIDDDLDPGVRHRLLDDLARLGSVRDQLTAPTQTGPALTQEQLQLLELLAAGASIPEAAAELYVSVRTAERRVAQVRAAFGVRTTAAALVAFSAMSRPTQMAGSGDTAAEGASYGRRQEVLDP